MELSQSAYDSKMQHLIEGLTEATEAFYDLSNAGYWRQHSYTQTSEFERARRLMQNLSHLIEYVKR
ncbi:MAG: hypothetical protein K0R63_1753 [Rickettsiales bacterium]|jgi:hypothetical protein|nr:hypothetical protein [Rickettsiales bacterium]